MILHHWSYEREHWLDVIPLCLSCHRKVHIGLLDEPRTGRRYVREEAEDISARRSPFCIMLQAARGQLSVAEASARGRCSARAINWWEGGTKLPKLGNLVRLLDGYALNKLTFRTIIVAYREATVAATTADLASRAMVAK